MEFGIDLGTTQSRIAYVGDTGEPVLAKSELGDDATPSVVFFESPHHAVVGRAARDEALLRPDLAVQLVKRDMGTPATYIAHGETHTPEMVSALILREVARAGAAQSGQQVRDVLITVPATFGIAQREATRRAGELAGLVVLDTLAEPVAAAIHYTAVHGPVATPKNALVCDLGGGTFDTSVIRLSGNDVTVVCNGGDASLGGADWDQVIADALLQQFAQQHPGLHPEGDPQFMQDLLLSAERLKRELSSVRSRRHVLRFDGLTTIAELSRSTVEDRTAALLSRVVAAVDRTLATARAKGVTECDEVLLVGGMTRFPAVTRALTELLGAGVDVKRHEPELAVAKGAALYARALTVRSAGPDSSVRARRTPAAAGSVPASGFPPAAAAAPADPAAEDAAPEVRRLAAASVAEVVPRAFGVIGIDGSDPAAFADPMRARKMVIHLLLANTELPADTGPYTFLTAIDNQRMVELEVWEQAGPELSDELAANRKVGRGMLRGLPANLPARSPIEVTFFMTETGQLTVQAKEPQSATMVNFDFQIGDFDSSRLQQARQAVAKYKVRG